MEQRYDRLSLRIYAFELERLGQRGLRQGRDTIGCGQGQTHAGTNRAVALRSCGAA
jgi:hypothetical protein